MVRRRRGTGVRTLGVDLGSRRIGIAVSDPAGKTATPYAVIDRSTDERDSAAIAELARAEDVALVVVGLPLTLDGDREHAAAVAEAFGARLGGLGVAVELWDERLSTAEAQKRLRAGGVRGAKARAVVDKVAASIILQSYLDASR